MPHQTHAFTEVNKANEFFINTSITIAIKPKTEAKTSNPNKKTTFTSMFTRTSKPVVPTLKNSVPAKNYHD